ncbi:MAG: hypothetical protein WD397_10890 [Wenzhouxiangellaceae bacterium]
MNLTYSEPEAALQQAACLSRQLANRYRHALEHLVEGRRLRAVVNQRAGELEAQADTLDDWTRSRDLLPRDWHTEYSDLQALADEVTGWLDDGQAHALSQRFAGEERELLAEMDTISGDDDLAAKVRPLREATCKAIETLDRGNTPP